MDTCPVCFFPEMREPPTDFAICPCCGTEFGYSDAGRTLDELRQGWIRDGERWHSQVFPPPLGWDSRVQLLNAGYGVKIGPAISKPTSGTMTFQPQTMLNFRVA